MENPNIKYVIDAHVHCGMGYSFGEYLKQIKGTPIKGSVVFPLADDIYQRVNKSFRDNNNWKKKRKNANKYVLLDNQPKKGIKIFPFKFMWNDFNIKNIDKYFGVKLQRRDVDAGYALGSPKFLKLLNKLKNMNMPIIFENELEETLRFVKDWSKGLNIIIPHLGFGSRTYDELKDEKIWEIRNVYTDTSYVSDADISGDFIKEHIINYGHERIFFGSDYGALDSNPKEELEKILSLDISDEAMKAITSKNILRLMDGVRKPTN